MTFVSVKMVYDILALCSCILSIVQLFFKLADAAYHVTVATTETPGREKLCHLAVMSGNFISENSVDLARVSNSDLNDHSIALFHAGGLFIRVAITMDCSATAVAIIIISHVLLQ